MKVYVGSDHKGFILAKAVVEWLQQEGKEVVYLGNTEHDPNDDYVDFGVAVGRKVSEEEGTRGLVFCGSGVGMDITANKIPGIRSCLAHSQELVKSARQDDDVNVLALGSDFISLDIAKGLVMTFLQTPYAAEERYQRRIEKLKQLEG